MEHDAELRRRIETLRDEWRQKWDEGQAKTDDGFSDPVQRFLRMNAAADYLDAALRES